MMKDPRFIIIIPFYNAKNYLRECLDSILGQAYPNWLAVCADDHSDDGSSEIIPADERMIKIYNNSRVTALPNIVNAILHCSADYRDDDILCLLDGDDKFLHPYSLSIVNELYLANPACLLTYGQYITSLGRLGSCEPYAEWEFAELRKCKKGASHLKTFRWKLYKEFLRQDSDLKAYKDSNGNFYTMSSDPALMYPLLEIAGFENIKFNKHPVYWYRIHEKNDSTVDIQKQKKIDAEIRLKRKFKPVFAIGTRQSFPRRVKRFLSRIKHGLFR